MRPRAPRMRIRMHKVLLVELVVVVELVEVSKICQPLQNRPNPKKPIL